MKNKPINILDDQAISEAIRFTEGRSTARNVSADDITELSLWAENQIEKLGLAKSYRPGAKATYLPGAVCGSYNYPAYGTWVELRRSTDGWLLTGIERREVGSWHSGSHDRRQLILTKRQQRRILDTNPALAELAYYVRGLERKAAA